jgi:hypothetical protein
MNLTKRVIKVNNMKKLYTLFLLLFFTGCTSTIITNDNSYKLLTNDKFIWLSINLDTNEFAVLKSYMKEEVLPTVVNLEKALDNLQEK